MSRGEIIKLFFLHNERAKSKKKKKKKKQKHVNNKPKNRKQEPKPKPKPPLKPKLKPIPKLKPKKIQIQTETEAETEKKQNQNENQMHRVTYLLQLPNTFTFKLCISLFNGIDLRVGTPGGNRARRLGWFNLNGSGQSAGIGGSRDSTILIRH
jgi:hypothetical protein